MLSSLTILLSLLLVITCVHAHKDNIFSRLNPVIKKVEKIEKVDIKIKNIEKIKTIEMKPIQLKTIDIKPMKAEKLMEIEPIDEKINSNTSKEEDNNDFNDLEEAMLKELKKLERD